MDDADAGLGEVWIQNLIEDLEPGKKTVLLAVCRELNLSQDAIEGVEFIARRLREFEVYGKSKVQTQRQRVKALTDVARLAAALDAALRKLPGYDLVCIHQKMAPPGVEPGTVLHGVDLAAGGGLVGLLGPGRHLLTRSVQKVLDEIGADGRAGGRKPVQPIYAGYVADIWGSARTLQVGRGGDFERLCDAVFEAAGVPAKAEGAIRVFLDHRKQRDESWLAD